MELAITSNFRLIPILHAWLNSMYMLDLYTCSWSVEPHISIDVLTIVRFKIILCLQLPIIFIVYVNFRRGARRGGGGLLWGVHSSLYTGDVHGWVWNENPLYFSTSIIVIIFLKVDLRNSNTTTIWTFVLEWYVVRGGSKNEPYKRRVFKRDQTTCSKYATHCIGQLNEHENLRFNDK